MQSAKGLEAPSGLIAGPDDCAEQLFFSDPYRNPWLWVSKSLSEIDSFCKKCLKHIMTLQLFEIS